VYFNKFISYLTGYVEILIKGAQLEKIINLAMSSGLFLWDVRRLGPEVAQARIRAHGFKRMRGIAKKSGCKVEIHRKKGWPFFRRRLAARKMFLISGLLCFGFLIYISSLILVVKVDGAGTETGRRIRESLAKLGLKPGHSRREISAKKGLFEREIILLTPEAVWIGITIRGTVAEVKVVPRKKASPPIRPRDIVADEDGIITKVAVFRGIPVVKEGDTVARGDLLISGREWRKDIQSETISQVEGTASGIVEARVWEEIEVLEPKIIWRPVRRPGRRLEYKLRWGKRIYRLGGVGEKPGKNYCWERRYKRLYQGRNPLKIVELIKDIQQEVAWRPTTRRMTEIKKAALAEAVRKRKFLQNGGTGRMASTWSEEDSFVRLRMTLESIRDIGRVASR